MPVPTIKTCFARIKAHIVSWLKGPGAPACSHHSSGSQPHPNAQSTHAGPPPSADMLTPSQGFAHTIDFDSAPDGGAVEASSEQWSRQGNTLRCDTSSKLMITCSGLLVPVTDLKAKCIISGKFTEEYERCFRCGCTVCLQHCKALSTEDGIFLYCENCLKKELKNWNTWVEVDGKLEVRRPPKPFCPASGSSVHGRVSHESNETGE